MLAETFEIKVAVLGNVSAGKSTVLNALFREKFSEVAMKRTTVGANFFRVHTKDDSLSDKDSSSSEYMSCNESTWHQVSDNPGTAESILKEITEDNRRLRDTASDTVSEKKFDIELDEKIIQMGKNTKLVFVDVPGINEAGTDNKYKEYVSKNWHLFDCVILVIDGKRDVRTDDQIHILKLIKENLQTRKIPVIVLCNKVDYITEEQEELVRIAQAEVKKIFGVSSSTTDVERSFSSDRKRKLSAIQAMSPVFISTSAMQAYIYRLAPRMTLDKFKKIVDMPLIEEFGGELVGRVHWRKLSNAAKVQKVYDIVTDLENCKQGIDDCNFELVLRTLAYFLGGEDIQRELIVDQFHTALKKLESGAVEAGMSLYVKTAYEKLRLLDGGEEDLASAATLMRTFWKVFQNFETKVFNNFEAMWKERKVSLLVPLMDELFTYHSLCTEAEWYDEEKNVISAMHGVVRRLINIILKKEQDDLKLCKDGIWYERSTALSPFDWNVIKSSILLLSHDKHFVEAFGSEKMDLEQTYPTWQIITSLKSYTMCRICGVPVTCSQIKSCTRYQYGPNTCHQGQFCSCIQCPVAGHQCLHTCVGCNKYFTSDLHNINCAKCKVAVGSAGTCATCNYSTEYYGFDLRKCYDATSKTLVPVSTTIYSKCVHVKLPSMLSDTNHLGHILWKYCQFMNSLESS